MNWILFSTLTILAVTICSSIAALAWVTTRPCSQCRASRETAEAARRDYTELTRTLLGVQPASVSQTQTTLPPPSAESSMPPEDIFDGLSPEIQAALMREYEENLARSRNLSGAPPRIHPEVEQITPGQVTLTPT